MSRHEKRVAAQFEEKCVCTFLPLLRQIHKWTDRRVKVEVPLVCCYCFVRVAPTTGDMIESLRAAINEKIPCFLHAFISVGRRVRIRGGSLDGMQGILVRQGADQSL